MPESPQGIYAPLPQSLSDSESEEEIHNSNTNRNHHMHQNHNHNNSLSTHHNQTSSLSDSHGGIGQTTEIKMNYQNSHNSTNCEDDNNVFMGVYTDHIDDNIAILQDIRKKEPMSIIRKCCFILSIQICILTVIVFIWVLPCSDDLSCPVNDDLFKTHKWIREYEKIELKGMINIVDGLRGRSKNFVFMYRGDNIFNTMYTTKRNGIICLIGSSGQVGWYDETINEPSVIDCNLIDADHDGSLDCLVTDEFLQLGCINPISGQWLWHIHNNPETRVKKSDLLDFPLILPDINGDGVNDLLLASTLGTKKHNNLIIVSGSNGEFIGKPYTLDECNYIHKLQIDQKLTISFNCVNKESELEKSKSLSELMTVITNRSQILNLPIFEFTQHKFYGQRKNTLNQRNIYSVSGKQLIVENRGKCPDNCNVTVMLIDQKNGKDYMLSNASSMYGMVPAQLSFNKTKIDSKSSVHGFVIKFWEFNTNETFFPKDGQQLKRSTDEKFKIFSNMIVRRKRWILPTTNESRNTRNIKENFTQNNIFHMKMRLIKETIVLIVFNSTETRIVNTSQSNIVQFCRDNTEGGTICQPDLNYQENSLVVADLDNDGSQELISYYTTYIKSEDLLNEWKLITYVQLLRLESELPQLYDTEIKN